jgi:primosomal protein N' (replication factor Y)
MRRYAQPARYAAHLRERANPEARLPPSQRIDTRRKLQGGRQRAADRAIKERLERGEQSLVFLNRRGYAPVLACTGLRLDLALPALRRQPGAASGRPPPALPPLRLRGACRVPARPAAIRTSSPSGAARSASRLAAGALSAGARLRVDRDSVKSRKQWEALLERIHGGEADILVGTQMLAKGHDFPKLTLVGALGADAACSPPTGARRNACSPS